MLEEHHEYSSLTEYKGMFSALEWSAFWKKREKEEDGSCYVSPSHCILFGKHFFTTTKNAKL